jgi:hypothetical protein
VPGHADDNAFETVPRITCGAERPAIGDQPVNRSARTRVAGIVVAKCDFTTRFYDLPLLKSRSNEEQEKRNSYRRSDTPRRTPSKVDTWQRLFERQSALHIGKAQ